jgi:hypothetical protein
MEEFEKSGQTGFNLKWSPTNGQRITSHRIINEVRIQKRLRNEELSAAARRDYQGALFSQLFSYYKDGRLCVMEDAGAIAKRYTKLQTGSHAVDDDSSDSS